MKEYEVKKEIFKSVGKWLPTAFETNDTEMVLAISELMKVAMQLDDSKESIDVKAPDIDTRGAPLNVNVTVPTKVEPNINEIVNSIMEEMNNLMANNSLM